ncbi:MAG TPA: hypothetical protein VJC05_03670 [Candidatus Andersenbacteria bacterium]|nr:hypothetical protein [Candidatus Andersenbacteria bacterium]
MEPLFVQLRNWAWAGAWLVVALALFSWLGFFYQSEQNSEVAGQARQDSEQAVDVESVPELPDILSEDQATRLTATRRLAERVGVETALEILEASDLPHTGEGHLAVHQVGFHAYELYGPEAILHCKDYFLYACYHGAIIEAATDQGLETVAAMADTCKASPSRYFQCAHAVGHAMLAMWNYDLPEALKDCDEIFEKEQQAFPGALSSCHNGAFMENLFGVHDWGTGEAPVRDWLKDDEPYFPCTAFEEKYQQGCWLNQAARIYTLMHGDIAKTRESCEHIGNPQYTEWCVDNLARQIHPLTAGDVGKVYSLCSEVGPFWREKCIVVNAGSYYSVGDPATAIAVCRGQLSPPAKTDCYQTVAGQLIADINIDVTQKEELCRQMEMGYNENCLQQLRPL